MRCVLFVLLINTTLFAQVKDIYEYGSKVNDYIAFNLNNSPKREINLALIDSIFSYSLAIADSNIGDALLFASTGTMIYKSFVIIIPILNVKIPIKVFSKTDSNIFNSKIFNLPSHLFDDSPSSNFGDKDKIVHFFSTAYISYIFGRDFSFFLGIFVEEFEKKFKIDGSIDERDLKINQLGAEFGQILRCKIIPPSIILVKEKSLSYGKNTNY